MKREFNLTWGIIGFCCGMATGTPGMGVALGFIFGYLVFPNRTD
jgi:hypothetical protein